MRRINVRIQNQDTGRANTLSRNTITPHRRQQTDDEQRNSNDSARNNSHRRRDPIIFERVFDEENDAQKKRESADPSEQFEAEYRFPIERTRQRTLRD